MDIEQKIKELFLKIDNVNASTPKLKQAKQETKNLYMENKSKFESMTIEQVKQYNPENEVIKRAKFLFNMDRLSKKGIVKGLETHTYAPELNKLHLYNGSVIFVYGVTEINEAIKKVCVKYSSKSISKALKECRTRLTWLD